MINVVDRERARQKEKERERICYEVWFRRSSAQLQSGAEGVSRKKHSFTSLSLLLLWLKCFNTDKYMRDLYRK